MWTTQQLWNCKGPRLHDDHDDDLIATVTDQPVEWIVPRGSADGT